MSTRSSFLRRASILALVLSNACSADVPSTVDLADDAEQALSARSTPEPDYTTDELEALADSPGVVSLNEPFDPPPAPSQSVYVTVSDGTRLALSLYFPEGFQPESSRAPVVYIEGWYPRAPGEARGEAVHLYRRAGFVVAIGDPRGFGASFGAQPGFLLARARKDQTEMIAWLRSQPWSDGRVAAVGFSISGTHAEAMAASGAAGLRAAIIRESDWDNYTNNLFPGGVPNLSMLDLVAFVLAWMRGDLCPEISQCQIPPVDADPDFKLLAAAFADHQGNPGPDAFASLVYRDDPVGAGTVTEMSAVGHIDEARRAAVPARVSASWLDGTTAEGALRRFRELANVPMEVFIGAHVHSGGLDADPFSRQAFGPARPGAPEQFAADVAFVERVLNGEAVGRSVRYYVLGARKYKTTTTWPPRGVKSTVLEFTRNGLTTRSSRDHGERRYRVDPTTSSGTFSRWAAQVGSPVYYGDRRFAPGRPLSFDAEPVPRDMELVGAPELCLVMSSDQTDGLVLAYLEDVSPDGRVTYLTEGNLRLLHRKTRTGGCDAAAGTERTFARADGSAVVPGELMQIELPLLPVAALIRRGHHLRLSLAGADAGPRRRFQFASPAVETFPMLTETPATWLIAFGGPRASRLTLPLRQWSAD